MQLLKAINWLRMEYFSRKLMLSAACARRPFVPCWPASILGMLWFEPSPPPIQIKIWHLIVHRCVHLEANWQSNGILQNILA